MFAYVPEDSKLHSLRSSSPPNPKSFPVSPEEIDKPHMLASVPKDSKLPPLTSPSPHHNPKSPGLSPKNINLQLLLVSMKIGADQSGRK